MSVSLRSYVCGRNGRAFQLVSGGVLVNLAPTNQSSSLSGSLTGTLSAIFSPYTLQDLDSCARLYSETDSVSCPSASYPQSGRILSMTQVGDAGYMLTREILEGFSMVLKTSDDSDQDDQRFDLWPAMHRQAYVLSSDSRSSPSMGHELAKYYSSGDAYDRVSGVSGLTALLMQNWLDDNMVETMPYSVSAIVSASWLAAAADLSSSLLFDVERRMCETSFDFPGRQRLLGAYDGPILKALRSGDLDVYHSHSEGLPNAYLLEWRTTDPNYQAGSLEFSVNPMRLKGFYSSEYQPDVDEGDYALSGCRNYIGCGTMQDSFWLSYKTARDLDDTAWVTRDFAHVERVRGLYKMSSGARHKSNLFSLRIRDSGLNSRMDSLTGGFNVVGSTPDLMGSDVKTRIQAVIEEELRGMMALVAPANAELWKVTWEGL